nr:sulfotransferase [Myxococcota bacterium]
MQRRRRVAAAERRAAVTTSDTPARRSSGRKARAKRRPSASRKPRLRRGLLVLGAHRSGTSALTRVLSLCGATLPSHLMPGTDRNPAGYFESQVIFELHEQLLREAGRSWDDLGLFHEDWFLSDAASMWVDRLTETVHDEFGESPLFVLKDPRLCHLVPLWKRVLENVGAEPSCVLIVRNPLEVAESLKLAQGTELGKGMLLWLQHLLLAERDTRDLPRSLVSYDDLLRDWRAVVDKISSELGIAFPRRGRRAEAEISDFLTTRFRHHKSDPSDLFARHDVIGWIKRTFEWVGGAAAGEGVPPDALDEILAAFQASEMAFGPVLATAERTSAKHARAVEQLREQIGGVQDELRVRHADVKRLQAEAQSAQSQIAVRGDELRQAHEQLKQLVELVKFVLNWSASLMGDPEAPPSTWEVVDQALETADPQVVPQIAATGMQLLEETAKASRLAEESAARAAEIERIEQEVAQLSGELTTRDADLARAREEVTRLASETATREADLTRAREEVTRLANESATQEADLTSAREEIARLANETATREADLTSAREEIARLANETAAREADLTSAREEIARL